MNWSKVMIALENTSIFSLRAKTSCWDMFFLQNTVGVFIVQFVKKIEENK